MTIEEAFERLEEKIRWATAHQPLPEPTDWALGFWLTRNLDNKDWEAYSQIWGFLGGEATTCWLCGCMAEAGLSWSPPYQELRLMS